MNPDPRDGSRFRVFSELASRLGPDAWTSRDFPSRVQRLLSGDRRLGSRDRRLQRELLFSRCRHQPWTEAAEAATPGGGLALAALLGEDTAGVALAAGVPASLASRFAEAGTWDARIEVLGAIWPGAVFRREDLAPEWFRASCPHWQTYCAPEVLWKRPPLWLRLRRSSPQDAASVVRELGLAGASCEPSGVLPGAWRTDSRVDLTRLACFARGLVEVQDLGSQLILEIAAPGTGERWLDACAGAGGKTLQLASMLGEKGRLDAEDPREAALGELLSRARRAGLDALRTRTVPLEPAQWKPASAEPYDGILIDAPCSGTGTWRRHPHLRHCTAPDAPTVHAEIQLSLLRSRAQAVRPGGHLVYATCSLCREENEAVVARFLEEMPSWSDATPATAFGFAKGSYGITVRPEVHDTDGFYVAVLCRSAA